MVLSEMELENSNKDRGCGDEQTSESIQIDDPQRQRRPLRGPSMNSDEKNISKNSSNETLSKESSMKGSLTENDCKTKSPSKSIGGILGKRKASLSTERLKDLLLLQLNLIEHQQNKISDKDKQIIHLRTEKEQLEARLSRMERRITLQKKQTADSEDPSTGRSKTSTGAAKSTRLSVGSKSGSKKPLHSSSIQRPGSPVAASITVSSRADRDFRFNTYLKTGTSYLHLTLSKLLPRLRNKKDTVKECEQAKIEVPSWRIVTRTDSVNGQQKSKELEPREACDEETYVKRHNKFELDEKRRKRWDLQHLRQQRQHEQLLQKHRDRSSTQPTCTSKQKTTERQHVDTLCPIADNNVMAIDISTTVPVCAFGHHVPCVERREMTLPWFSVAKREVQLRDAKLRQLKKEQTARRKSARR